MPDDLMERLKFHLKDGVYRGWSRWYPEKYNTELSEAELEADLRAGIFGHWRKHEEDPSVSVYHALESFEQWPYHLVLELCKYSFKSEDEYDTLMIEPENLLERIVEIAEHIYSTSPQWQNQQPPTEIQS